MIATALVFIIIVAFAASSALFMANKGVNEIWAIIFCFASIILTNIYLFYMLKKRKKENITAFAAIVGVFNNVIFISSLVPLFIQGVKQDAAGVKAVVTNIYIFYGVAIGLVVLGFLLTLFLIKEQINQSNWWVFAASLPYIFIGWIIQRDFNAFHNFVNMDDFTNNNVANMIRDVDADMLLLNPSWYKFLSVIIIVLVLMIGMIASEVIWKKTSGWRKKGKKEEAAKNKTKI